MTRRFVRFVLVGSFTTLVSIVLYAVLRMTTGPQVANLISQVATAILATLMHRQLTFSVRDREGAWGQHLQSTLLLGLGLAFTSSSMGLLHAYTDPSRQLEIFVLVISNGLAGLARFAVMHRWVYKPVYETVDLRDAGSRESAAAAALKAVTFSPTR